MSSLTMQTILDMDIGFYESGPCLIKKYTAFRLSIYQTNQKTEWGWTHNEFVVSKLMKHGKSEEVRRINFLSELKKIINDCTL